MTSTAHPHHGKKAKERFLVHTAVYVILKRGEEIYVMRRANSGYRDGEFSLPAGHIEQGETLTACAMRELWEETGLEILEESLEFAHVVFFQTPDRTYHDYFFVCNDWSGEPRVIETHKCDESLWARPEEIPGQLVPEVSMALEGIAKGTKFSQLDLRI